MSTCMPALTTAEIPYVELGGSEVILLVLTFVYV